MRDLFGLTDDGDWKQDAMCAQTDPELFFPDKGGSVRDAKMVCGTCDVSTQCLAEAIANEDRFGVWGGMTPRERRGLVRRRKKKNA